MSDSFLLTLYLMLKQNKKAKLNLASTSKINVLIGLKTAHTSGKKTNLTIKHKPTTQTLSLNTNNCSKAVDSPLHYNFFLSNSVLSTDRSPINRLEKH